MYILGIETSCDETGSAIVKNGREILSNVVASSLKDHKKYGGIIPEIRPNSFIFKGETSFYDNLFPKGYKDYPFATYVDRQSQVEHMLPDAFLVDVGPDRAGNPKLVFKNPRFES